MNAERLHAIAKVIRQDLRETNSEEILRQLGTALQNQVNQPQQPSHQNQVAQHLNKLTGALEGAPTNKFPPTWRQVVDKISAIESEE